MEELGIEKKEETEIELAQTNLKQASSISTAKGTLLNLFLF